MKKKTENLEETIEEHKEEIRRLGHRVSILADRHHELNVRMDRMIEQVSKDFRNLIKTVGK